MRDVAHLSPALSPLVPFLGLAALVDRDGGMSQGGESDGGDGSSEGGRPSARDFPSAATRLGPSPSQHARAVGAWRAWLAALASDAEAALAAAMTYGALAPEARDAWLDALERDRGLVEVPLVALYAPLLAVEGDEHRRARISYAMGTLPVRARAHAGRALRGKTASGDLVCAVATPLYLDFVELLVCRYDPERGVLSAHHEPFRNAAQVSSAVESSLEEAIALAPAPLRDVIEELAHAVVADGREGRAPPEALARFSHLFGPDLEAAAGDKEDAEEDSPAA
jgi:hypothetical protein